MVPEFIRIVRKSADKEILVRVSSIWKIDVKYYEKATQPGFVPGHCSLGKGLSDPDCVREYTIFFGGETAKLVARPGSKVMRLLEDIYRNALADEDDLPKPRVYASGGSEPD
jgi:hypothetical protein